MALFPRYEGSALIDHVCSIDNLTLAWRRVRSNIQVARRQRSAGTDAVTLRDFEADWPRQMAQLAEELQSGSYRPCPVRHISIPKSSGGQRAIAILAVRDRIAQRAVQQVLEPLFEPLFLDCSYGCRPQVGVPEAVARVERYAQQGLTWVVDADIATYFDSLDQRILLGLLRQRVAEVPILRLIAQWLEVGTLAGDPQAPLLGSQDNPFVRGGQVVRRVWQWGMQHTPSTPLQDPYDPYAIARWEQAVEDDEVGSLPRTAPPEQRLWAALMLARPVMAGARHALPYVQRLGSKKVVAAGAVAATVLAASEFVVHRQGPAGRGTPQGGALSPLLANLYLHPFDLALTSQGLRLVRFMDDFVIMCANEVDAQRALTLAERQLSALRLTLNTDKTHLLQYGDGLEFLGRALAPRGRGSFLSSGVTTFEEAEHALRRAAGKLRHK